jgi:hypothetical protein
MIHSYHPVVPFRHRYGQPDCRIVDGLPRRRPEAVPARVGHSLRRRRRRVALTVSGHLSGHQQELFEGEPAVEVLLGVGQQGSGEGRAELGLDFRSFENDSPQPYV